MEKDKNFHQQEKIHISMIANRLILVVKEIFLSSLNSFYKILKKKKTFLIFRFTIESHH